MSEHDDTKARWFEDADLVRNVTQAVRRADEESEKAGGSSRHWVRDHFLPALDDHGLVLSWSGRDADPPAHGRLPPECGRDWRLSSFADWRPCRKPTGHPPPCGLAEGETIRLKPEPEPAEDPKARLAHIEQTTNAASEGPWEVGDLPGRPHGMGAPRSRADAEFIAMARTAMPWLIEEVKRLSAEVFGDWPTMQEQARLAEAKIKELTERAEKAEAEVQRQKRLIDDTREALSYGCIGLICHRRGPKGWRCLDCGEALKERAEKAERELAELRAEQVATEAIDGTPWSLRGIVEKLCEATEHLLQGHDCDLHGHEGKKYAAEAGRRWLTLAKVPRNPLDRPGVEVAEDGEPVIMPLDEIDSFARRMLYEHGDQRPWMALPVVCNTARAAHALKAERDRLKGQTKQLTDEVIGRDKEIWRIEKERDAARAEAQEQCEAKEAAYQRVFALTRNLDAARALSEQRRKALEPLLRAQVKGASGVPVYGGTACITDAEMAEAKAAHDAEEKPE